MKIVYCTDSICYPGGIQTITIIKANALAQIDGNEVYIIVTDNKKEPLKELKNVTLVDLDVNYFEDDYKGWWYVMKGILWKRQIHKKRLEKALQKIQPDVVISTGTSEKNFLPSIKIAPFTPPVFIREIHSGKNYRRRAAQDWKGKMLAYLGDWYDFSYKIKKYDKIVVLTHEDKEINWRGRDNVVVMPNPMTMDSCGQAACEKKVVIAAGRLVQPKNFMSLVRCWKYVAEKYPDWELNIWGTGCQEDILKKEIKDLGLDGKVLLKGFTSNIYSELESSSVYVLSSEFEGFPLVLIEAMSVGLPVVAYACPTGPKDIVNDGQNGFLIPVNDEKTMAEKLCVLMGDESLRKNMGREALLTSENYRIDKIVNQWMELFKGVQAKKRC